MSDLAAQIEAMAERGLTFLEARKIHEIQVLGEAIVMEGRSAVVDVLFENAMAGYSAAIEELADVDPYAEKERFYRAQRDLKRFRDMVKWINEILGAVPIAKEVLDEIEENKEKEENFNESRQASYPDD